MNPLPATLCPICYRETVRTFQRHGFWLRECAECLHRFFELSTSRDHVGAVYGDDYFFGGRAGYDDYLSEGDLIKTHGERYVKLLSHYCEPGTVLDVGCAAGFLLKAFVDGSWTGTGLEPNARMAEHARTKLGLEVKVGDLEAIAGKDRFDLISMVQVAAHFYDSRAAFSRAFQLTRPGGLWLIETWDWRSWTAWFFGKNWHEYSPPSVLHCYSRKSLDRMALHFGMEKVATGRPKKRLNGAHAKSLLRYKLGQSLPGRALGKILGIIPDGMPIPYPAGDLFWALYRKPLASD